ncbi:MAG: hypothetical protein ACK4J0_04225, partial [Candidatus Anstonellaceae archaeon]
MKFKENIHPKSISFTKIKKAFRNFYKFGVVGTISIATFFSSFNIEGKYKTIFNTQLKVPQ